jgi:hypothetical protein
MRYYNRALSSSESSVKEAIRFLSDKEPSVDLALNRLGMVGADLKNAHEEWDKAFYVLGQKDGERDGKDIAWKDVAEARRDARNVWCFLFCVSLFANGILVTCLLNK